MNLKYNSTASNSAAIGTAQIQTDCMATPLARTVSRIFGGTPVVAYRCGTHFSRDDVAKLADRADFGSKKAICRLMPDHGATTVPQAGTCCAARRKMP